MKNMFDRQVLVFLAICAIGMGCSRVQVEEAKGSGSRPPRSEVGDDRKERREPEIRDEREERPSPGLGQDSPALKAIKSPLARRYLSFLVAEDGRLASESHGGSMVKNAFAQSWALTSRMDLTPEQQDSLAEFLLREDWSKWATMDPKKIEEWAKQNLSAEQQITLKDFLAEQKEGAAEMEKLRQKIQRLEHGNRSDEEILAAEMATLKAYFSPDGAPADPGPPPVEMMDADTREKFDEHVDTEQAFRFYNLLAARIPLTEAQHPAVFAALRRGERAPINPYDYQALATERAEAVVRKDTRWLGEILTGDQYETYVRHFLAEIEMIRFETNRR